MKPKEKQPKRQRRTRSGARLYAFNVRQKGKSDKPTAQILNLSLGDPVITPAHFFTDFLVSAVCKAGNRGSRIEDEIFQLEIKLRQLKQDQQQQQDYLTQGAESIDNILEGKDPLIIHLIWFIKRTLSLTEYIEKVIVLEDGPIAWQGKCPLPKHQGNSKLQLHHNQFDCAGCGIYKGDVIEFVRRLHQLTFEETVRRLRKDALIKSEKEKGVNRGPPTHLSLEDF